MTTQDNPQVDNPVDNPQDLVEAPDMDRLTDIAYEAGWNGALDAQLELLVSWDRLHPGEARTRTAQERRRIIDQTIALKR